MRRRPRSSASSVSLLYGGKGMPGTRGAGTPVPATPPALLRPLARRSISISASASTGSGSPSPSPSPSLSRGRPRRRHEHHHHHHHHYHHDQGSLERHRRRQRQRSRSLSPRRRHDHNYGCHGWPTPLWSSRLACTKGPDGGPVCAWVPQAQVPVCAPDALGNFSCAWVTTGPAAAAAVAPVSCAPPTMLPLWN